jgi:hypothetical protein
MYIKKILPLFIHFSLLPVTTSMVHLQHPETHKKVVLLGDLHENSLEQSFSNSVPRQKADLTHLVRTLSPDNEQLPTLWVVESPPYVLNQIALAHEIPEQASSESCAFSVLHTIPQLAIKTHLESLQKGIFPVFELNNVIFIQSDTRTDSDSALHMTGTLSGQDLSKLVKDKNRCMTELRELTVKNTIAHLQRLKKEIKKALQAGSDDVSNTLQRASSQLTTSAKNTIRKLHLPPTTHINDAFAILYKKDPQKLQKLRNAFIVLTSMKYDIELLTMLKQFEESDYSQSIFQTGYVHLLFLKNALQKKGYKVSYESDCVGLELTKDDLPLELTKDLIQQIADNQESCLIFNVTAKVTDFFTSAS